MWQKEIVCRAIGLALARWPYGKRTIPPDRRIVISLGDGGTPTDLWVSFRMPVSDPHTALKASPVPFAAPLILCLFYTRGG